MYQLIKKGDTFSSILIAEKTFSLVRLTLSIFCSFSSSAQKLSDDVIFGHELGGKNINSYNERLQKGFLNRLFYDDLRGGKVYQLGHVGSFLITH